MNTRKRIKIYLEVTVLDNYEYNIKSDQIKKLYSKKDYSTAAKVADSIDWRRVKNNTMLNLVADVYDRCKEYEKARDVLLIAYDRTTCGRQLAYKLTILSLRLKDFVEADEFYQDFVEMAPDDTTQYILKYRIAKTKGEHIDVLIQILEAYAEVEMDERWQYELAKLYEEAGRTADMISMCDQIILWFSEGKYVEKAMTLKMKYQPLTPEQQIKYDNRLSVRESKIEDALEAVPVEENKQEAASATNTVYDTRTDILNDTFGPIPVVKLDEEEVKEKQTEAAEVKEVSEEENKVDNEVASETSKEIEEARKQVEEDNKKLDEEMYSGKSTVEFYDFGDANKEKMSKIGEDLMKTAEIDIDEINFRAMNITEYDTANIQAAIAKSMEIIMKENDLDSNLAAKKEEASDEEEVSEEIAKTQEIKTPVVDEETARELEKTKIISTSEIRAMLDATNDVKETKQEVIEPVVEEEVPSSDAYNTVSSINVRSAFEVPSEEESKKEEALEQARNTAIREQFEKKEESLYHTVPLDPLFEQEEDGQIGLASEEEVEEQIEGQMTIEEVLHEYEIRAKYEAALAEVKKYEAEIKKQEERRKAREAAIKLEEETVEDTLDDDNTEEVTVEETGEAEWIDTGELPVIEDEEAETEVEEEVEGEIEEEVEEEVEEEEEIDERQDLINALFGEIEEPEEEPVAEEEPEETPADENLVKEMTDSVADGLAAGVADMLDNVIKAPVMEGPEIEVPNIFGKHREASETEEAVITEDTQATEINEQVEAPVAETPVEETPVEETPVEETPDVKEPTEEMPVCETPVIETPVIETPIIETPVVEEPKIEPPVDEEQVSEITTDDFEQPAPVALNRDAEELGRLRLSDEYRAVFADFLDVPGLEEQLVNTIDHLVEYFEMDGTSKNNNVIIMGDEKTGKTTLGLGIIKVANRARGNGRSARKVAKIKAEVLNKKGVTMAMPKILGTDLIIEKAGNLTYTTVTDLLAIMKTYTEEMLIVLEDDQAAMERLISANPEIGVVFGNQIYIKGHTADDYVRMAKDYAAKRRYTVDEMGTLALYARIGDIFGRNQYVTKEEIEEIIDEAIEHSERGGIKKLISKMKRNKDELGILKEEDFV